MHFASLGRASWGATGLWDISQAIKEEKEKKRKEKEKKKPSVAILHNLSRRLPSNPVKRPLKKMLQTANKYFLGSPRRQDRNPPGFPRA
jgi:hypothetical protein